MKLSLFLILTTALVFLFTSFILAQPGGGLPPMLPGNPNQAPIDGGLGLLAVAGGAYAYKKLKNRRRDTET